MDVASPELGRLPDEIMDTEAGEELEAAPTVKSEPSEDPPVAMEMDPPTNNPPAPPPVPDTTPQDTPTATTTESETGTIVTGTIATASITTSTSVPASSASLVSGGTASGSGGSASGGGLQKLAAPFTISAASHQIILNKLAASQASEAGRSSAVIKQDGQKLLVTTIGKSGQPIVLQLPPGAGVGGAAKAGGPQTGAEPQSPTPQFKVVTIGGRAELKPVVGSPPTQLKTVQIAKKTPASSAAPIKFIITKTLNSKVLTPQPAATPVLSGRVVAQTPSSTPPARSITLSESLSVSGQKIAISPLKSPSKVTVVSVASRPSGSSQKSVSLPVNVALGQQILAVQQSSGSPVKVSSQQTLKPVQSVSVGGVSGSQFKTIIPLASQSGVHQIQVPGSRFHYVRLVTASTASSTGTSGTSTTTLSTSGLGTSTLSTSKPVVMSSGPVRMSVPIVPAQAIKQVAPKPLPSPAAVASGGPTQQRLIMPATPLPSLPQLQPNFTNLPPGTVLAPAPGAPPGLGYAVLPAQYLTQLQSPLVTLSGSSGFPPSSSIQSQARPPLNGLSAAETSSRPRKPCNCTKSQCLKLYCDCFANGEFCSNCNCNSCFNNLEHEPERLKAIKTCLDRNPEAFKPKIGKGKEGESDRRHSKGCNCKRSGCLKNYCECYEAKIMCSSICKCVGCKNFEESPERKTLMHLADAADMRVQQQTAARTKLSSQISDLLLRTTPVVTTGSGRLPYTFLTQEVLEATCECLVEAGRRAELSQQPQEEAERRVLEEFGHCLLRIISSAGGTRGGGRPPISC